MRHKKRAVSGAPASQGSSSNNSSNNKGNKGSNVNRVSSNGSSSSHASGRRSSARSRTQVANCSTPLQPGADVVIELPNGATMRGTVASCVPLDVNGPGTSQVTPRRQRSATLTDIAPSGPVSPGSSGAVHEINITLPILIPTNNSSWDDAADDVQVVLPLPRPKSRYKVTARRNSQPTGTTVVPSAVTGAETAVMPDDSEPPTGTDAGRVAGAAGACTRVISTAPTESAPAAERGRSVTTIDNPDTAVERLFASRLPWQQIDRHLPQLMQLLGKSNCFHAEAMVSNCVNDAVLDVTRAAIKAWKAEGRSVPEGLGAAIKEFGITRKVARQTESWVFSHRSLQCPQCRRMTGTAAQQGGAEGKREQRSRRPACSASREPRSQDSDQAVPSHNSNLAAGGLVQFSGLMAERVAGAAVTRRGAATSLEQHMTGHEDPFTRSTRDVLLSLLCCIAEPKWVVDTLANMSCSAVRSAVDAWLQTPEGIVEKKGGVVAKVQLQSAGQPSAPVGPAPRTSTDSKCKGAAARKVLSGHPPAAVDTAVGMESAARTAAQPLCTAVPIPTSVLHLMQHSSSSAASFTIWVKLHTALWLAFANDTLPVALMEGIAAENSHDKDTAVQAAENMEAAVSAMQAQAMSINAVAATQQGLGNSTTSHSKAGAYGQGCLRNSHGPGGADSHGPVLFDISWAGPELQAQLATQDAVNFCLAFSSIMAVCAERDETMSTDVSAILASQAFSTRLWQLGLRGSASRAAATGSEEAPGAAVAGDSAAGAPAGEVGKQGHCSSDNMAAGCLPQEALHPTASNSNGTPVVTSTKRHRKWHTKQQKQPEAELDNSALRQFTAWMYGASQQAERADAAQGGKEDAVDLALAATAATEAMRTQVRHGKRTTKQQDASQLAEHQQSTNNIPGKQPQPSTAKTIVAEDCNTAGNNSCTPDSSTTPFCQHCPEGSTSLSEAASEAGMNKDSVGQQQGVRAPVAVLLADAPVGAAHQESESSFVQNTSVMTSALPTLSMTTAALLLQAGFDAEEAGGPAMHDMQMQQADVSQVVHHQHMQQANDSQGLHDLHLQQANSSQEVHTPQVQRAKSTQGQVVSQVQQRDVNQGPNELQQGGVSTGTHIPQVQQGDVSQGNSKLQQGDVSQGNNEPQQGDVSTGTQDPQVQQANVVHGPDEAQVQQGGISQGVPPCSQHALGLAAASTLGSSVNMAADLLSASASSTESPLHASTTGSTFHASTTSSGTTSGSTESLPHTSITSSASLCACSTASMGSDTSPDLPREAMASVGSADSGDVLCRSWRILVPYAGHNIALQDPVTSEYVAMYVPSPANRTFTLTAHTPAQPAHTVLYNAELYYALLRTKRSSMYH